MPARRALGGLFAIAAATGLGLLAVTALAASPTMTLTATDATIGGTVHATAQLSASSNASGQISFEVFGPDDPSCAGPALTPTPAPAPVSGDGQYVSGSFSPTEPGTYHWSAHYPGDAENDPADASCAAASVVAKASPALTGTATSATVGQTIQMTAQLSGSVGASGQISFEVFGPDDPSCAGPALTPTPAPAPVSGDGQYVSGSFSPTEPGTYHWSAHYPGDAENDPADASCAAASVVAKASPALTGTATSATVGQTITDSVTLVNAHQATGQLTFSAFGPDDETCSGPAAYTAPVAVSGDGAYSPPGFAPGPGLYRWTVEYGGDANNQLFTLGCGSTNQSSVVGTIAVPVTASAGSGVVGKPLSATATIGEGGIPAGQITFRAFAPGDASCSGTAAFSSTVAVAGSKAYSSAAFTPTRVGTYRWTVAYSGDANHEPVSIACGKASSTVAQAAPSISGRVKQRAVVGAAFRDTVTIADGYAPSGTVTFRIYGPNAADCSSPDFVDTVKLAGEATVRSDPFIATAPGRYVFVATYSGDAANRGASEACGSGGQTAAVAKRRPRLKPIARLIVGRRIAIRARLSGGASPSGFVSFRLYRPGDSRCRRTPAFRGGVTAGANGILLLAKYLAARAGIYRLVVGYSGDPRNKRLVLGCAGAQLIRIR